MGERLPQSYVRALLRVMGLIALSLVMFTPVLLLWVCAQDTRRSRLVHVYYCCAAWICGLSITVEGALSDKRPLLLAANHSSYLDIFVLGTLAPLSFTPKREIRSWPVIGFFSVLADCVFIERRPAHIEEARREIAEKLEAGKVVVLFPEGTTGDGRSLKPFKSGFLSLLEGHNLPLQAVTVAYTHIGQVPLNAAIRDRVAWIGEATLVGHLLRLLSFPSIAITLRLHPQHYMHEFENRKALAKAAEHMVGEGLKDLLARHGITG